VKVVRGKKLSEEEEKSSWGVVRLLGSLEKRREVWGEKESVMKGKE